MGSFYISKLLFDAYRKPVILGLNGHSSGTSLVKDVLIPLFSAAFGSIVIFFAPKLWQVFERRYVDPKTALLETLHSQIKWYADRASKLVTFRFELSRDPPPDIFKLEVLISRLDPRDREWAIKETDIASLINKFLKNRAECWRNAQRNHSQRGF